MIFKGTYFIGADTIQNSYIYHHFMLDCKNIQALLFVKMHQSV